MGPPLDLGGVSSRCGGGGRFWCLSRFRRASGSEVFCGFVACLVFLGLRCLGFRSVRFGLFVGSLAFALSSPRSRLVPVRSPPRPSSVRLASVVSPGVARPSSPVPSRSSPRLPAPVRPPSRLGPSSPSRSPAPSPVAPVLPGLLTVRPGTGWVALSQPNLNTTRGNPTAPHF